MLDALRGRPLALAIAPALAAVLAGLISLALIGPRYNVGLERAGAMTVVVIAVALLVTRCWRVKTDRAAWCLFTIGVALHGAGYGILSLGYPRAPFSSSEIALAASYLCFFLALGIYMGRRVIAGSLAARAYCWRRS